MRLQLKPGSKPVQSDRVPTPSNKIPPWGLLSLATNGILMLTVALLLVRGSTSGDLQTSAGSPRSAAFTPGKTDLGPRHQMSYEKWVATLAQEAEVVAQKKPEHLAILAGDSISLWFPPGLLPPDRTWLNQGISGETSAGLRKRLGLFNQTQPETIFVMIGINDLIRGVSAEAILENYRQIIRDLLWAHPTANIVVQSILPHGGAAATWEGRDRLLRTPNPQIQEINRQIAQIAQVEGVKYLNLFPLFIDAQGKLRTELTTDGLHLNEKGYLVWRSAIELFTQLELARQPLPEN